MSAAPSLKWLENAIARELRALERARRRFIDKPTQKRLHDVRTTGRRFRSLLEDVAELSSAKKLLRRVKRVASLTDAARDATILRGLLERTLAPAENAAAAPLLAALGERERDATRRAHRRLRQTRLRA